MLAIYKSPINERCTYKSWVFEISQLNSKNTKYDQESLKEKNRVSTMYVDIHMVSGTHMHVNRAYRLRNYNTNSQRPI